MQNINWDDLRYCLAVAREGSVTAAARKLEVNHTTVSRRISALEQELNVTLFDRSTAGWLITPVGETILGSAGHMADEVSSIRRLVQADRQELSGKLRVTAVDICIQRLLLPPLKAFARQYPDIEVELIASTEMLDLSVHDADIAFRTTNQPPPNVVGKHIADFAYTVYATPELYAQYLENPRGVSAITWSWAAAANARPAWLANCFPEMAMRYRVNVNMPREGWLFLADANYPGWESTVNGKVQPVYSAQVLGKAVRLQAGRNEVTIRYVPWSFYIGAVVSAATLLLILWLLMQSRRQESPRLEVS